MGGVFDPKRPLSSPSVIAVTATQSLRGKGLGPLIDSFDQVIRFNNHVAGGEHADDIGSKVTIWASSIATDTVNDPTPYCPDNCRKIWYRPREMKPPGWSQIPLSIEQELMKLLGQPAGWPTTGLLSLYYLSRDFPVIHTAGWWKADRFAGYIWERGKDYYFDGPSHVAFREIALYREWVSEGRIVEID